MNKELLNAILDSHKAPYPGIIYDFEYFPDKTEMVLVFYRDNFNRFPDSKQVLIAEWIHKLVVSLNDGGILTTVEFRDAPS